MDSSGRLLWLVMKRRPFHFLLPTVPLKGDGRKSKRTGGHCRTRSKAGLISSLPVQKSKKTRSVVRCTGTVGYTACRLRGAVFHSVGERHQVNYPIMQQKVLIGTLHVHGIHFINRTGAIA